MFISIVIPVYKVEPYIVRCIESVLCQTYRHLEVILVDDCSPDRSMELAKGCIEQSPLSKDLSFVYLRHDHNRGLSAARNTGMNAASGDYVFFLDSDDEISTDCIEKLVNPLKEELYDLVVGNIQTIGDDQPHNYLCLKLADGTALRDADIQNTYRKSWNMMAQNKLYRMDFLQKEGLRFKEGLIHEDELWSLQIACLAQSLRAVSDFTYLYKIRPGSIITKSTEYKKAVAMEVIVTEGVKFLKERKIHSIPIYRILQDFFYLALIGHSDNWQEFYRVYILFRKRGRIPVFYRIQTIGWHVKLQIINLHHYLPYKLGACLLYQLYQHGK